MVYLVDSANANLMQVTGGGSGRWVGWSFEFHSLSLDLKRERPALLPETIRLSALCRDFSRTRIGKSGCVSDRAIFGTKS